MITDEDIKTILAPKLERLLELGYTIYYKTEEVEVISSSTKDGIRIQFFSDVSGCMEVDLKVEYFRTWNTTIPTLSTFEDWFYIPLTIDDFDNLTSAQQYINSNDRFVGESH